MIGPEPPPSTKRKRDGNEEEEDEEKRHRRHRRHQPDFNRLAAKYDYFARHVITTKKKATTTTTTTIDFTSWQATHDLCRALLEEIGVQNWSIPEGHLVPGFTQRRNYCEWVESLLEKDGVRLEEDNIRGVDVGTGASAIFALLFTSRHPKWDMFGTDITKEAVESARRNCSAAGAAECSCDDTTGQVDGDNCSNSSSKSRRRISIRDVSKRRTSVTMKVLTEDQNDNREQEEEIEEEPILDLDLFDEEHIDFTVCNPPFFNSMSDSSQNPRTNFGGTRIENSCRGGESSFVRRMILESRRVTLLRKTNKSIRVRWFTTMVGVKATLKMAKKCLREMKETTKIRETAFVQGKTRRWGLAWSFERAKTFEECVNTKIVEEQI